MNAITINKKGAMSFKESNEKQMGGFGGRKLNGKIL